MFNGLFKKFYKIFGVQNFQFFYKKKVNTIFLNFKNDYKKIFLSFTFKISSEYMTKKFRNLIFTGD